MLVETNLIIVTNRPTRNYLLEVWEYNHIAQDELFNSFTNDSCFVFIAFTRWGWVDG